MTEIIPDPPKDNELNVYIEASGHLRYMVVEDGEHKCKERIPLHVMNMTDLVAQKWFFQKLITKLKRKMFLMKVGPRRIASVTPIKADK